MKINYSDQEVIKGEKSIFLAGPTPRKIEVKSWRDEVCKKLEELGFDGVVYVPEYSTHGKFEDYDVQSHTNQVEWERTALLNASVILFWIPREIPDMPAFTTNVEFGYWIHTGKIIYGRPDEAVKNRYLDWLYKKDTNTDPYNNLDELLKEAINKANITGVNHKNEILPLKDRKLMK